MNMKYFFLIASLIYLVGCEPPQPKVPFIHKDWTDRKVHSNAFDSLIKGETYLSTYSQIYTRNEYISFDLTVLVSLRNVSSTDTVYITKASYYNTKGKMIHEYLDFPIYLGPLESTEIVIDENDIAGGTGSSFMFSWRGKKDTDEPLFEGIMFSTLGPKGLSFTTKGIRIK